METGEPIMSTTNRVNPNREKAPSRRSRIEVTMDGKRVPVTRKLVSENLSHPENNERRASSQDQEREKRRRRSRDVEIEMTDSMKQTRRQQKKKQKEEKRKNKKPRLRIFPIWLRLLVVSILCIVALGAGLMIGYGGLGDGEPRDALKWETWQHIIDIVIKEE